MKKKILYVITQSQWGGAQRYVLDLATSFRDEFEVVVAFGGVGELKGRLEEQGVRCIVLRKLVREINPRKDIPALWELYRLIRKEKPDILHTNSSKVEILGNLAGWLARVPKIVFTAHGFAFNDGGHFWRKKGYICLERFFNLFSDRIICVSESDRKNAMKSGLAKERKLIVIRNGIDVESFNPSKVKSSSYRTRFGIPSEAIIICFIGRFVYQKNPELFVQTCRGVVGKMKEYDLRFIMAGDGQKLKKIMRMAREYGLQDRLYFPGMISNPAELLSDTDIFLLTSRFEGLPYVILEALAMGVPVVGVNVDGVPEAVVEGKGGFLVEPGDPRALAEKIKMLLDDPDLRASMGAFNRERVASEFSLEKMIARTKRVYEEVRRTSRSDR